MRGMLTKCLLWAVGFAVVTAFFFETFSYGVAHANPLLLLIFFGAGLAYARDLPGIGIPGSVFLYQLAYYVAWALVIAAVVGLVRTRNERLRKDSEGRNAS